MPRKKENIHFTVVPHFEGNKPIKDLIGNLIMREANNLNQKEEKRELIRRNT